MTDSVCNTEFVIIAIRKAVPQKSGARTIDCAMDYCVIVLSIILKLFYNDRFTKFSIKKIY